MMDIAGGSVSRLLALVLACLQVVAAGCRAQDAPGQAAPLADCRSSAKGGDPWLQATAQRIRTHDQLFTQLIMAHGPPASCSGGMTQEFDGKSFGSIRFEWASGLSFALQTAPPESSVVELAQPGGFTDKNALLDQLKAYVGERGIPIDWSKPQMRSTATGRTEEFASGSPGMNARVSLQYEADSRLTSARLFLAL